MERASAATTELVGMEIDTHTLIKSNCEIPNRQCHIMAPLKQDKMLIGLG